MTVVQDARKVVKFVWDHPANEGKRVRAVLRAINYQARGRLLNKRTLARIGDHSYIWASLHRTGASKAVYANPPDHPEMVVWQRALRPGDLFIDVGANVGSYSILAGDLGADVIALEPAPDTLALLVENVRLNGYLVTTIRAAAGANCGTARFTIGQDCANRLAATGPVEIEMVALDSVVRDRVVAGMKIDVEGFEFDVLLGCDRMLSQQRLKLIQLEWNSCSIEAVGTDRAPIAELLARYGYRLYRPGTDGTLVPITDLGFGPDVFA
jgi:FkbM family methyltransferase